MIQRKLQAIQNNGGSFFPLRKTKELNLSKDIFTSLRFLNNEWRRDENVCSICLKAPVFKGPLCLLNMGGLIHPKSYLTVMRFSPRSLLSQPRLFSLGKIITMGGGRGGREKILDNIPLM